jgi:putative PIN family toxin of toxin-antitoxin system
MKVFFDTNVYVAEALLREASTRLIEATVAAGWRIHVSPYVLDEIEHVIVDYFGFSRRLASLSRQRVARRAVPVAPPTSRHAVPDDPKDSPILQAALAAGSDYLVTNDRHLLSLDPSESLRIISLANHERLLADVGLV